MATVTEYDAATSTSTSNVNTYDSASFSPGSTGELLVVSVVAGGTSDPGEVTASANGVSTFYRPDSVGFNGSINETYLFVAEQLTTGTSAMTVTFDCTGDVGSGAIVMVCGVVGMSKTGVDAVRQFAVVENGTGGTNPEFVFASACLTDNVTIYAIGEISSAGLNNPTNWTEGAQSSFSSPTIGGAYGYRESGFTGTTVTWPASETAHGGIIVELDTSSSGASVTPDDSAHAHTADSPTITQVHEITAADSAHAHASESPAITQVHSIAAADSDHGHTADSPTITQTHVVAPNDSAHEHAADSPTVTQVHNIVADDSDHAHSSDSPAITQVHVVAPDDSAHAHTADSPSVAEGGGEANVTPDDSTHGHTSDSPTITQVHSIAPDDSVHAHAADSPSITQVHAVTPTDSAHSHTATSPALTQTHVVTPADSSHEHTAETPTVIQTHVITPDDSTHGHTSDSPNVIAGELPTPPPERTLTIPTENRTLTVILDNRTDAVPAENRTLVTT